MSKRLTLITQHGAARSVRRTRFGTYAEAVAHAEANTPDTDGSMVPEVDPKYGNRDDYSRGFFWFGNRYAVLLDTSEENRP